MQKPSLKDRFQYWFDNRMSKGSLALIRILIVATVIVIVLIACLISVFGFNDEENNLGSTLWDSFATIINQWIPSFEDGKIGYVVLMSVAALFGLLFTSVLIGIFSSAIEEKIQNLKKGNSRVLEKDHYVILGFKSGEYTLVHQLVIAASGNTRCIVVAGNMEKDKMDEDIRNNVSIPRNIKLICRSIDIYNPVELEKCSITTCKTVIISPTDDLSTAKALLVVTGLIRNNQNSQARIAAIVSSNKYQLPKNVTERHNVNLFQTNVILAKIIAHTCTQVCLSQTFEEIFNFEGSEMYIVDFPDIAGMSFLDLSVSIESGVPIGLYNNSQGIIMSPDYDHIVSDNDKVIIFAEDAKSARKVSAEDISRVSASETHDITVLPAGKTVIIGSNEVIDIVISELPENVEQIVLAGVPESEFKRIIGQNSWKRDLSIQFGSQNIWNNQQLFSLVADAAHVVVLNDHNEDIECSDMNCIMQVLKLRDLRERFSLEYNITAELHDERNMNLISFNKESTDYIVASNLMSLFLAQLAENAELYKAFQEILSNEGNEIYLKTAGEMQCTGEWVCAELRAICLYHGYVFLGYNKTHNGESINHFNPSLTETIMLEKEDRVIVMGYN